ncbi:MAG: hypothetical protein LLP51_07665 [Halorhodospira halophila]|uniref:hypothetical protein n=1 Tax=Halorhodospira TaxID=85108 RepID=UPI001912929C|nr:MULTISPECIES: hypothetical protein [Halorhodospira]MBK5937306.1 hypothetical protein [Halorhodospira halophila]MBK5944211.1 hypothetical protein [Halorhodospira halophila]MCC3751257.1 hypothetical protein [Halorhodospira halophila]MCG5527670.1 hypothetical protein [Halorhodospira halophila]MCG5532687.1 hypothetical protein [Halorhodospira sp. 9621]
MDPTLQFLFWVVLLVVLLFYPVSQWIWVLSVRRLQRRLDRELSEEELAGQKRRARVLTAIILPVFSFFLNSATLGVLQ